MPSNFVVIMAGGSGTRLWPLSTPDCPKQLLPLLSGRTLLEEAFTRAVAVTDAHHVIVIAAESMRDACIQLLPDLAPHNYIGEPCPRDTAAAIAVSAAIIEQRDPGAGVCVITADHYIEPLAAFAETARRALAHIADTPDTLVTFGIKPTSPHTGYGYLEKGLLLAPGCHTVARFTEKPDDATARRFVDGGNHCWNSGMFCWRAATILRELDQHLPPAAAAARRIAIAPATIAVEYELLQRISIDRAVMEKTGHAAMFELDVRWIDVGSWTALAEILKPDADGNVIAAGTATCLDARGNTIYSSDGHIVAAVGVEGLVIVHTPQATLVCKATDAQRVREIAERFK